jgi:MFS family permease
LIDTLPLQQRIFKVGHWLSFPLVISSIASPLFGIVVDRYGKRIYLLILGTVMLVTSFTMFLSFPPLFPLIFYGIGYSLFTISWGMIPYMVPGKVVVRNSDCIDE